MQLHKAKNRFSDQENRFFKDNSCILSRYLL